MMKNLLIGIVFVLAAGFTLGCEEEEDPTRVWGWMQCDQCESQYDLVGGASLEPSGGRYQGYCKRDGDDLSFVVSTGNPSNLASSGFYFRIDGIKGPPSEGAYSGGEELRTGFESSFSSGRIALTQSDWRFTWNDVRDSSNCTVDTLAKAAPGELTPNKYDKQNFQYVVVIECNNDLTDVKNESTGQPLSGFWLELWFDKCG
jgi:hypothetical protein